MTSEFPLFLLPMLVLNRILKLMTPFELVAISLCSKKSKMVCKSARSQMECKNGTKEFTLKFSLNKEIRLKFDYHPRLEWVFKLECFPKINNIPPGKNFLQKFKTFFRKKEQASCKAAYTRVTNDLFINTWIPTEDDTTSEHSLQLFTSEEDQWSNTNSFIQHLSDILNVSLWTIELHFQDFIREENERIIDFYYSDHENKTAVKSLTLIGKYWNTPEDDEVVDSILQRQEAKIKLKLIMKPTSEFKFRSEYLRNKLNFLKVQHSHWISFDQLLEIDPFLIILNESTFTKIHLKSLFEKWSSGWTPKWRVSMIKYAETVDIDDCFNELDAMGSFSNIRIHREEETYDGYPIEETKTTRYFLRRADGTIGVLSLEGTSFGTFFIFMEVEENVIVFPHLYQS
ncbi:hypothetical protein GCK72_016516 [Caenorhabditis remanei]|uniref:F-box domain-containing protein n=1 Tax=Caenorhabditis remanei TaxID=31234 RepID=A0A6A5G5E8_CAERE|nr:hypothetical protein GCK72_016516 [Caenorhabditis remanei]KAF1749971.1 hypothetical protein GCK72_016516 [Caenorhabditis remanei]